ncbi:hypothetical protein SAMN05443572_10179 [Myxococcus fulvus]|uniref:Lipoprotein n=1 Tax=Myxococcus fulvus TaxID=33 RepID=A0A511T166_MYXFU|nr:hypothetical protein [Myxococcus fulvus]AKF79126.1 hypothetical protein MFUL124B02_01295 [Myxococcus fulvus 124B02]GEN07894.1 hypothetical protein MFU01_29310 [Myxococcus fulvus]SES76162.1 hypothetical protein SAMN05443572_10179 [Myxococcus fulvus]
MKKKLLSAVMVCALGFVGCGDDDDNEQPTPQTPSLNSSANILAFLEGKSMIMEGNNIPSHPNGFSEDVDYGASSQCYQSVTMSVAGGNFKVDSIPGTITNNVCDHNAPKNPLSFTSNTVLIENVAADGSCFDVTFSFPGGLVQEGRGGFTADQKTLKLELYFKNQATGIRCANGAVGTSSSVTLNGQPFTGNAVQTYSIR